MAAKQALLAPSRGTVELGPVRCPAKDGSYFAWDPLAAVALLDPSVVRTSPTALEIVQQTPEDGRTRRVGSGKANVDVAFDADAQKFRRLFLGALSAR